MKVTPKIIRIVPNKTCQCRFGIVWCGSHFVFQPYFAKVKYYAINADFSTLKCKNS